MKRIQCRILGQTSSFTMNLECSSRPSKNQSTVEECIFWLFCVLPVEYLPCGRGQQAAIEKTTMTWICHHRVVPTSLILLNTHSTLDASRSMFPRTSTIITSRKQTFAEWWLSSSDPSIRLWARLLPVTGKRVMVWKWEVGRCGYDWRFCPSSFISSWYFGLFMLSNESCLQCGRGLFHYYTHQRNQNQQYWPLLPPRNNLKKGWNHRKDSTKMLCTLTPRPMDERVQSTRNQQGEIRLWTS